MPTVIQLHGAYARARSQPVWALLASDDAAEALAIFSVNFTGAGLTQIPTGRFHERAGDDIRALNMSGATLNRTTSQYCSKWVSDNWLERNPNDAGDGEVYELTPDALMALDMVEQIVTPITSTTKSQVSAIMTQLTELNVRTDTNQETKLAALYARREASHMPKVDSLRAKSSNSGAGVQYCGSNVRPNSNMRSRITLSPIVSA